MPEISMIKGSDLVLKVSESIEPEIFNIFTMSEPERRWGNAVKIKSHLTPILP